VRARGWTRTIGLALALLCVGAPSAVAQTTPPAPAAGPSDPSATAGGREYGQDDPAAQLTVPGPVAKVIDGLAYAPQDAPDAVKAVIWAGNAIVGSPYRMGGGHVLGFTDTAYDCSGTVSYALHGADLLKRPRDSSSFFRFGAKGPGTWMTIFTKSSHAYLTVAGIRLDTSAADDPAGGKGPRWRPLRPSDAGFVARHPVGL
jgi:hypothetical protein